MGRWIDGSIRLCDSSQRIPCFDSCQLIITWMCNIRLQGYGATLLRSYISWYKKGETRKWWWRGWLLKIFFDYCITCLSTLIYHLGNELILLIDYSSRQDKCKFVQELPFTHKAQLQSAAAELLVRILVKFIIVCKFHTFLFKMSQQRTDK